MTISQENIQTRKDESLSSGNRKALPEQVMRCPRCDSLNTKFCYFNNYSLSQPRHFCKTCRRYWTKGGALRNVPIGGGCRKNKKSRSSSSRLSGDNNSNIQTGSTSELGSFKLFRGISPAMDFQLGGVSSFPNLYNPQFSSYTPIQLQPSPCFGLETMGSSLISNPLMGYNIPYPDVMKQGESSGFGLDGIGDQMRPSINVHSNIASSIESLSSINQDLHLKLQQQRLGLFSDMKNNQTEDANPSQHVESINVQKPQPIMFQNLDIPKNDGCQLDEAGRKEGGISGGDMATEWFFESSNNQNSTNNSSNGNEGASNWGGIQGWSDMNQYGSLP